MNKQQGSKSDNGGGIIRYQFPKGQVVFNVEYVEQQDPEMGDMSHYQYDYAICDDITNEEKMISDIIRSRYSQDEVESIFANHLGGQDKKMQEFQQWRKTAKVVVRNKVYLKSEIEEFI